MVDYMAINVNFLSLAYKNSPINDVFQPLTSKYTSSLKKFVCFKFLLYLCSRIALFS